MATQIQFRRDTAANWTSVNPILAEGELGLETDTQKFKMGNAVNHWNDLLYATQGEVGPAGATGPTGDTGPTGPSGADGVDGTDGVGVVAGGTAGQILSKIDATDYNTQWIDNYVEQIRLTGKNNSGVELLKGTVVYINGATGDNLLLTKADADLEATSSKTIGILNETLAVNGIGQVITEGIIVGVNTDGAVAAGSSVWLSTVSGEYVFDSPPAKPAHAVYLGVVARKHAVVGEIAVKVQNGYESVELHDFSSTLPTDGQVPIFNATTGLYTPGTITGGGGSTIARATATYTTASLAVNASETGTITLAKGYTVYKIQTSAPARVRLYGTTAAQTADASRALGVNALPGSSPMLEVKTETGYLTLDFAVDGASTETTPVTTIPISITNLNGSTAAITVTVTYIALEA